MGAGGVMNFLFLTLIILLNVAFLTLLERKILSYTQHRKGPNLVGPWGILQPFSDGLKLLTKNLLLHHRSSPLITIVPPLFFLLSLLLWGGWYPESNLLLNNFFLSLLLASSLGAIAIFFSGWGGESSYSLMGGVRASAQIISYEVIFSFLLLIPLSFSFSLSSPSEGGATLLSGGAFCLLTLPITVTIILAETNRAPFDLTEGESELVSGFNTEYSSLPFVFLFLGEYSFIIFFSSLLGIFFFFSNNFWAGFIVVFLWVRSCFPRKRYDYLMVLMWVYLFPLTCVFLSISLGVLFL